MKKFTKFFEPRPQGFRGHDFSVDGNSMTVPDVVPTLKEIILSGTATQVGTPVYDESFEQGVKRFGIQSAPLEMLLDGRDAAGAEADERSEENGAPAPARQAQEQPTPSVGEGQAEEQAD